MIKNKELYEAYKKKTNSSNKKIKALLKHCRETFEKAEHDLENYKVFFDRFCVFDYETITSSNAFLNLTYTIYKDLMTGKDAETANQLYEKYFQSKKEYKLLTGQLDGGEKTIVNSSIFGYIIRRFNQEIVKSIVEEDYRFVMINGGTLRVRKRKRSKPAPDWNRSNLNKQVIEEKGGTPLKVLGRDDEGNLITNGGIPWMEFFVSDHQAYFFWDTRTTPLRSILTNSDYLSYYTFVPTRGEKGIVKYLNEFLREDPSRINNYAK